MIKINHVALWVNDLEKMKNFYIHYFNGKAFNKYINAIKNFESYFVEFESGIKLELMSNKINCSKPQDNHLGYSHIAISVGSQEMVNHFTKIFSQDGFQVVSRPRVTGDGYYESVILDPEGNLIELTV